MGGIPERLWAAWVQTFLLCSSLFLPFLKVSSVKAPRACGRTCSSGHLVCGPIQLLPVKTTKWGFSGKWRMGRVGGVDQICSVLGPSSPGGISFKSCCNAAAGSFTLEVKPPHPDFKEKVGLELCLL